MTRTVESAVGRIEGKPILQEGAAGLNISVFGAHMAWTAFSEVL